MGFSIVSNAPGRQGVTMLVVRPHPDDESSATGGMLAYYRARGVRTGVVMCTGGEEGQMLDPDLDSVVEHLTPPIQWDITFTKCQCGANEKTSS